jgi:hypothetical protein
MGEGVDSQSFQVEVFKGMGSSPLSFGQLMSLSLPVSEAGRQAGGRYYIAFNERFPLQTPGLILL